VVGSAEGGGGGVTLPAPAASADKLVLRFFLF
jgi:hypothetical protein